MRIRERILFGTLSIASLGLTSLGVYYSAVQPSPLAAIALLFGSGGCFALSCAKTLDKKEGSFEINCNYKDPEIVEHHITNQHVININQIIQNKEKEQAKEKEQNKLSENSIAQIKFYEDYKKYKQHTRKKEKKKLEKSPELQEEKKNLTKEESSAGKGWSDKSINEMVKDLEEFSESHNNWLFTRKFLKEKASKSKNSDNSNLLN